MKCVSRIAQAPPQLSVLTQTLAKNLARLLLWLVTQAFPVNLSGTAKVIRLTCARGKGSFFLRITGWCRLHNTRQQTQNVPARHRRKHVETHCCLWLKKKEHTGSHIPGCVAYLDTLWDGLAVIQRETWGTVRMSNRSHPPFGIKASTQVNFGLHHSFLCFFTL